MSEAFMSADAADINMTRLQERVTELEKTIGFKVWHCSYSWGGGRGGIQEYECVIVAEDKIKALGMALTHYSHTSPECWSAKEIPVQEGVYEISQYNN